MSFFNFHQNNTGGSFDYDESAGISVNVIIEADNDDDADIKLIRIGGYFDGCDDGRDCSCCGDRWYRSHESDGKDVPKVYSDEVHPGDRMPDKRFNMKWMKDGNAEGFIHYADGRIEGFWREKETEVMQQTMFTNTGCEVDVEPIEGGMLVTTPVGAKIELVNLTLAHTDGDPALHLLGVVADDPETEIRLYLHQEDCPDGEN